MHDRMIECPQCESRDFEFIEDWLEDHDKWLTIRYRCYDCGAEWLEEFRRVSTVSLNDKEEDDV